MKRIETTIEFPYGIPCKKDVLGTEYSIIIGSHQGTFAFPNVSDDFKNKQANVMPANNKLLQPKGADKELYLDKVDDWGSFSDGNGNSMVKKCRIWFPCDYSEQKQLTMDLNKAVSAYFDKFILFLEIISKNAFDKNTALGNGIHNKTHYWLWERDGKMVSAENPTITLSSVILSDDIYVSKAFIEESLSYTNKNLEPNITHRLLRDSIYHKNNKDFRRAILDAATAVEITLTERIEKEFIAKNINDKNLISSLLIKYRSLRGRIDLTIVLNIKLPRPKNEYLDILSHARNKSIHEGYSSNFDEATKVIEIAFDTLSCYSAIYN